MAELPVPATGADEVRRIADNVLGRPEFADAQPSWWDRGMRWVFDFFGRLFEALGGGGRGSVIGVITVLVVVVVALFVITRFTRTVRRDPARDPAMDIGIGRSPRDWIDEARRHEAAGEWRDAVRCRYRALLAELAAAGLVDEVPGRTSGEYLAAVREDVPTAAEHFAEVTRRFERAWYGHESTTPTEVEELTVASRAVVSAAGLRRSLVSSRA